MRILIRSYDGNEYVWKDAIFKDDKYYITENGLDAWIREIDIAAVQDHVDVNYVICKHCGEKIQNTPEAIEKHFADAEKSRDCTKCRYLAFDNNVANIQREIVKNEDGTYHVVQKFTSELYCNNYFKKKINDPRANNHCPFYQHRKAGVRGVNSVFVNYPGAFDTVITSDVLIAKKFRSDGHNGRYFLYDMKSRGTIKACVNMSGIVECFLVSSHGDRMYFYYSEKYDKLFYTDGYKGNYIEGCPSWFRENKFEEAHKRIKALYEGAKNE